MNICYNPIGIMHCRLTDQDEVPKFYTESNVRGIIEIFEPFAEGLSGIEAYERIMVIFHFHKAEGFHLMQRSRGVGDLRGVFSLRSSRRPNGIGLSVFKLIRVDGRELHVGNVDLLDGTPILDIKPYKSKDYIFGE